jgi:MFS family permease
MDLPGTALLSVSLFSLTLALIRGQDVGWSSAFITGLFATSAVSGALLLLVESRVSHPIIDLRMLGERTFGAASVTILLFGLGFFGALFLVIQYLTVVEGYSALKAAIAITPFPACLMLTGPMAGRLSDRFGSRALIMAGVLIFGVALFSASRLTSGEPYPQIAWRFVVGGIGAGLIFAPLTSAVMGSVAGGRAAVGAGVFNTARQVGFTLGLAILVAVFVGALPSRITAAQQEAASLVERSDLPAPVKQGIVEGILSAPPEEMEQAARSGTKPSFDLYDRVKQTAGPELADRLRPTLDELSQALQAVFARSTASAFDRSFLVAAIFVWVAVLPVLLLRRVAAAGPGPPPEKPPVPIG